jgi:hypothetical protein
MGLAEGERSKRVAIATADVAQEVSHLRPAGGEQVPAPSDRARVALREAAGVRARIPAVVL